MKPKIAITDVNTPVPREVVRKLAVGGLEHVVWDGEHSCDAVVLIAGGASRVSAPMVDNLPNLELVARTGAGFEKVDLAGLHRRNVGLLVPRVPGDTSVAEYTIAAMLYLFRGFAEADAAVRAGSFSFRERALGRSLEGLTLGVVGFGRIGAMVAQWANVFGMHIQVWNPWSHKRYPDYVTRTDSLESLLSQADAVSIHCRLTPETQGLIGDAQLGRMRRNAILINTARGGLVDEAALARALACGQLAGAAVDCFADESEGMVSPLQRLERSLLTPHLAGLTTQSVSNIADFVVRNVTTYLATGAVSNPDHLIDLYAGVSAANERS
jgi:D-3-phosphoglycerate dehydrogenase